VRTLRELPAPECHRPTLRNGEPFAERQADLEHGADAGCYGGAAGCRERKRHLDILKWGLIPSFTKNVATPRRPINARCETVAKTPMFKDAFAKRRCLVPAAAHYEWRHDPSGKTPFAIARKDGEPVAFGGVWDEWRSPDGEILRTFATMTTQANPELALIQERMPVIIEKAEWGVWLGEEDGDVEALLRSLPADQFRVWPVSRKVNSVKSDGPELLEPLATISDEVALL
jgi:putative SOS response-associated peptidase YedK